MTTTAKRVINMALGLGISGTLAQADGVYNGYEAAPYAVERQVGAAELRQYQPHIVAEVTVRGAQSQALSRGFSELARYIFGGNTAADKVAMTTPVAQRPSEKIAMTTPVGQSGQDGLWTVTFTMPSEYTLDTLPVPNSDAVRFVAQAPERQIVLMFSGRATTRALDARAAQLRAIAAEAGVTLANGPFYYFYDDPMTLPWNRRNEVAYVVE